MKMARIILLATFFLFNLVLVPSRGLPFGEGPREGIGFGLEGLEGLQSGRFLPFPFANRREKGEGPQKAPEDPRQNKPEEFQGPVNTNLRVGFYKNSCPNAEKIVADTFGQIVKANPSAMANMLRLQFHDCFVVGCDASILLDYAPTGDNVEKSSLFNGLLLKGADLIDDIKNKLEQECPETVSCADILAFTTNEAMALAGMPRQNPLGGRRDALYSLATVAEDNNLPLPNWNANQMIDLFQRKGFTPEEMVILLGAHSIGAAHCEVFMDRAYNFENTFKPDPALPPPFVDEIRQICANPGTPQFRNQPVSFDKTPNVLDNLFFKDLEAKRSLLITDSHLIEDPRTAPVVRQMAADQGLFHKRLAELMTKLSSMNVLTGKDGEVRKTCRSTN